MFEYGAKTRTHALARTHRHTHALSLTYEHWHALTRTYTLLHALTHIQLYRPMRIKHYFTLDYDLASIW